jgi:LacI family transcriptional regulator, repressor for deo operon, udp, cdd, tsx, nupC, and nupG
MSDEMAIGALKVLDDHRIRVPEDMSVIGFDDQDVSTYIGLTTVHQPMAQLGVQATSVLFGLLRGEQPAARTRVLPVSLVLRDTTAPVVPRPVRAP